MEFAQRLSLLLEERGVSRGKLARFVGVHTSTVTNWVNGKKPSVDNLASVADFFGVSVSYLVGWDEAVSDLNMIGMSELDVAEEMGIDPAVLNNILSGSDASSAEAVSKFITVASLLAKKEKPTTPEGSELNLSDMELLSAFKQSDEATQELIRRVLGLK